LAADLSRLKLVRAEYHSKPCEYRHWRCGRLLCQQPEQRITPRPQTTFRSCPPYSQASAYSASSVLLLSLFALLSIEPSISGRRMSSR
jgi:hypothetical protein